MISQKDLSIISCLRENARQPLTKISKKIRVPISTIYDRIRVNESSVIKKYTSLLDFNKLGYDAWIKVAIKIDREQRDEMKKYLSMHPRINSLYKINNGYDFLFEGLFRHIKEAEDFIELLDMKFKIIEKKCYYVIEDLHRERFLSDPLNMII